MRLDEIILGPPKTAFSSAARIYGKSSTDATERPPRSFEADEPKGDRYNFRDKPFKDRDFGDKDFDRRDGKPGAINNRRGDKEDWNGGRSRRPFSQNESERRSRRNGEVWEGRDGYRDRDSRDFHNGYERGPRDKEGRFGLRRDGAKFEGSRFRDGNPQEALDTEDSVRSKDWRRERPDIDRDWNRGSKMEQEPEWLESNGKDDDKGDHRRVRTQEDFERWKEKMKASSGQVRAAEKKENLPADEAPPPKPELRPTDGSLFSEQSTPFQADATMEKFFGLLKDPKPSQETSPVLVNVTTAATPATTVTTKKEPPTSGKGGKSSRFAGLFSPQAEISPAEEAAPIAAAAAAAERSPPTNQPVANNADQEGFQRILQMLGGGSASGSKPHTVTPKGDSSQQPRPPSQVQAEPSRAPMPALPPALEALNRQIPQQGSPARDTPGMQGNPMKEPQNQERQHLLHLMQQVQIAPPAPQSNGQGQPPKGLSNAPEILPRHPQGVPPVHKSANFFDDPAIANMQRSEGRRLANPMGYLDDMSFPHHQGNPITPGGTTRVPPGLNPSPIGMQQPPGFEHVPRPMWAAAGGQPLAPPPGIAAPTARGGMNPNFPSNMVPMQGPPMNERQQPFIRGAGGPPPGMMPPPPPGYVNVSGPVPPGFAPVPHADPMMGHGPYGNVNPGAPGLLPSSRHLLDVLGHTGGGLVGPGNFR